MTLIFTNFHQLGMICSVRIDGEFNPNWNKQYIEIIHELIPLITVASVLTHAIPIVI